MLCSFCLLLACLDLPLGVPGLPLCSALFVCGLVGLVAKEGRGCIFMRLVGAVPFAAPSPIVACCVRCLLLVHHATTTAGLRTGTKRLQALGCHLMVSRVGVVSDLL